MTAYPWREEWQKVFCIEDRRYAVDMDGWFVVTAVVWKNGQYHRYGVHYGKKETAVEVYGALQALVDIGVLAGCYVYADACSVGDKAPCLMDSHVRPDLVDDD